MTTFEHAYRGQDVTVEVTSYTPFIPMDITGTGFGDCDMPQAESIEFTITDENGEWLADELETTPKETQEIMKRFKGIMG